MVSASDPIKDFFFEGSNKTFSIKGRLVTSAIFGVVALIIRATVAPIRSVSDAFSLVSWSAVGMGTTLALMSVWDLRYPRGAKKVQWPEDPLIGIDQKIERTLLDYDGKLNRKGRLAAAGLVAGGIVLVRLLFMGQVSFGSTKEILQTLQWVLAPSSIILIALNASAARRPCWIESDHKVDHTAI